MTSSLASRNVLSGVSRSSGVSVLGSVIYDLGLSVILWGESISPSLPALDSQVDLYPLMILLQNPVILAQRKALPSVRQQNPLHVRMPIELNSEHVIHFALQPVACRP